MKQWELKQKVKCAIQNYMYFGGKKIQKGLLLVTS